MQVGAGVKLEVSAIWAILSPPIPLCAQSGHLCLEAPWEVIQEDEEEEGSPGRRNNMCKCTEA